MRTISVPLILINLQDDGFHLLVEIVVFGESNWAVLDTGASRSVFNKNYIERHIPESTVDVELPAVNVDVAMNNIQATTIFSTSVTSQANIPALKIGKLNIKDYDAVTLDLTSVNEAYLQMGHPAIIGIIGGDILLKYNAVINYKKLKMFFSNVD